MLITLDNARLLVHLRIIGRNQPPESPPCHQHIHHGQDPSPSHVSVDVLLTVTATVETCQLGSQLTGVYRSENRWASTERLAGTEVAVRIRNGVRCHSNQSEQVGFLAPRVRYGAVVNSR